MPSRHVAALLGLILIAAVSSCAHVPAATPQEISARDQWAKRVSAAARQQVFADADRHTGWGEKRKIQYEIDQFQRIERQEQLKAKRATTRRSASAPATAPTAR